jgi:hypothetical protein
MLILGRFSREVPEKTSPAWRLDLAVEGEPFDTGAESVSISSSMVMTLG